MISNWGVQYTVEKIFLRAIRYYLCMLQKGLIWRRYGWKHTTKRKGGGRMLSHCIVSKGVHVWTSTMVILKHIFLFFLHNMEYYNRKNWITILFFFQLILCDSKEYLWQKYVCIKKCKLLKKWLKWFFVFMKFVIFMKHCDSTWLE
jgi:hypothetical protein